MERDNNIFNIEYKSNFKGTVNILENYIKTEELKLYKNTEFTVVYKKNYEKEELILSSNVLGYINTPDENKIMIIIAYLNKLGPSIVYDLISADLYKRQYLKITPNEKEVFSKKIVLKNKTFKKKKKFFSKLLEWFGFSKLNKNIDFVYS